MFLRSTCLLTLVSVMAVHLPTASARQGVIAGPVEAEIIRVIDGDTVLVAAKPWPSQSITTYVRLRGIDAPEMKDRCPAMRDAAHRAHEALTNLLENSPSIFLTEISGDKYYGRILADVRLPNGDDPADKLMQSGLVVRYDGGKKIRPICPQAE